MTTVTRYDFIEIKAEVTKEGWIRDNPIVTRTGIFSYRLPNGKIRKELRTDEEVFKAESLASLRGIPITNEHNGLITKDNVKQVVGTVISEGKQDGKDVRSEIIIHDPSRIGTKKELSLGYVCVMDETPGLHEGEKYDAIQKSISYNHLACVNKGRAGNAKLRLDSDDAVSGAFEMEDEMADTKLVVVKLDNIDYQAAPEVSNALNAARSDTVELKRKFDALEAERDSLKEKISKHEEEVSKIKTNMRDELKARTALEATLTQHEMKFDEKATDIDLKKLLITKLRPNIKLENKSDEYINSAYDLALEMNEDKNKKVSQQKQQTSNASEKQDSKVVSAEDARAKMIAKMRDQHFQQKTA